MKPENIIKGKRPELMSSKELDYLMHMTMVLTQELNVALDRIDTMERVLADKAGVAAADLEAYVPDQDVLTERESRRQNMLDTLFSVMYQEAAEIEQQDSKQRYHKAIKDIASKD